jgi:hypothetical protein
MDAIQGFFYLSLSSFFGFDFWVQDDEDGIQNA